MTPNERLVLAVNAAGANHETGILAVPCVDVEAILHGGVGEDRSDGAAAHDVIATGTGCSPGAAVGRVYFTADDVLDAADRGELVILAASETSPADEVAMRVIEGVLTAKGGMASHAAVVARGWGLPAVCGAEALTFTADAMVVDGRQVEAGTLITLDGASGEVFLGDLGVVADTAPPELDVLLGWADHCRADDVGIRANADTADDAAKAREFGAQGIGLCRTEHMFMGDRLPVIQAVLTAADDGARASALSRLVAVQADDFASLFEAMDGLPVTVRLLDAPLHEFVPDQHEHNPMLGFRGVRLAIVQGGIFEAQVQAIIKAIRHRIDAGGDPQVDIMVPLVATVTETTTSVGLVRSELEHGLPDGVRVKVGTMIETPRAALVAAEIAPLVDFFSFGTNDLTQLTFGFSRDDVEGPIINPYIERGLLDSSPFAELDTAGVGQLISMAVQAGRDANPDLEFGVCGEHGGDPASIDFFVEVGLDYVSCSPYRVPIARLATAQALIAQRAASAG